MQPSNRQALPYVLLLGFILGSTLVVSRFSLGQYHPFVYISLRLLVANFVLWSNYFILRRRALPRDWRLWGHGTVLGLFSALPIIGFVTSLQYQSSGVTSILNATMPVMLMLAAHYFLVDEPLRWHKMAGALVAFAGVIFLLLRGETGLADAAQADWRGYALLGMALVCNVIAAIYTRLYLRTANVIDLSSIRLVVALTIVVVITLVTVGFDFSHVELTGVLAVLYAGGVGTIGGVVIYFGVIQRFGATTAAITEYIVPLVTTTLGILLLGEVVTLTMVIGMILIFIGIGLANRQTL